MKIATILGARPQFIKAAPVSKALCTAGFSEIFIHTGQHYDENMSDVFFNELELARPEHNLGIGSGDHGRQTGRMLEGIENVLQLERPDWVLVYGDTNSTLAGALAASKLRIPVGHVEAGLRSFNRAMPEEINRILVDHVSEMLFCPSQTAIDNLRREGITKNVHLIGDVMYDAIVQHRVLAKSNSRILETLGLSSGRYLLATVHRAENNADPNRLAGIMAALGRIGQTEIIVFPVHPGTRKRLEKEGHKNAVVENSRLKLIDPVGYLDTILFT